MKLFLCAAAVLLYPAAAFTQGNPGPFGGLFGRTPSRTGVDYRVFEIRGSGGVQWNDVLSEEPTERPEPTFAGLLADAASAVTFDRRSDRLNIHVGSRAEHRHTLNEHSLTSRRFRNTSADASVWVVGRLTTRVSADASANYRYSPYYQFFPSFVSLGEGVVVPGLPFYAAMLGNHQSDVRIGGSFQYARHSTLTASATHTEMRFPSRPQSNVTSLGYEGLWTRRINRQFGIRLGYGRHHVRYRAPESKEFIEEQIEAGVDFRRALTISPRTQVAFKTGTSVLRHVNRETRYRLTGDFSLSRRFRRTWIASFNANRSTDILLGFVEPVLLDTVGLSMSGLLADRVEWVMSLRGHRGEFASEVESRPFAMTGAITQLNIAVTRQLGVYAQYSFYHHDSLSGATSITQPGDVSRQTFMAGVTTWIPIFTRERTPIDSR